MNNKLTQQNITLCSAVTGAGIITENERRKSIAENLSKIGKETGDELHFDFTLASITNAITAAGEVSKQAREENVIKFANHLANSGKINAALGTSACAKAKGQTLFKNKDLGRD